MSDYPGDLWKLEDFVVVVDSFFGFSLRGLKKAYDPQTYFLDFPRFNTYGNETIPLKRIENSAFERALGNIREIRSFGSVEVIGNDAFSHNKLTAVEDWGAVRTINEGAFAHNHILSSIPRSWKNVTSIGTDAFKETWLDEIPELG